MCMEYVKSVFPKKKYYTQDSLCEEAREGFVVPIYWASRN